MCFIVYFSVSVYVSVYVSLRMFHCVFQSPFHCMFHCVCFIVCVFLELNEQFDEMLRRNEDVVKEAINNLNTQTSQRPLDTDWTNVIGCILQLICMTQRGPRLHPIRSYSENVGSLIQISDFALLHTEPLPPPAGTRECYAAPSELVNFATCHKDAQRLENIVLLSDILCPVEAPFSVWPMFSQTCLDLLCLCETMTVGFTVVTQP